MSSSCRTEQLDEILALAGIFGCGGSTEKGEGGEEEGIVADEGLSKFLESDGEIDEFVASPISFRIRIRLRDSSNVQIAVKMPARYPEEDPPLMRIRMAARDVFDSAEIARWNARLQRCIRNEFEKGAVCLHAVLDTVIDEMNDSRRIVVVEEPIVETFDASSVRKIFRKFFWTHHTRVKQRKIYEWSARLRVTGLCTVSRPGYLLVEGEEADMKEFTRRNMAEKWKEIRITWEETEEVPDVDSSRWFKDGLREVTKEEFIKILRTRGKFDALKCGTRGAVKPT